MLASSILQLSTFREFVRRFCLLFTKKSKFWWFCLRKFIIFLNFHHAHRSDHLHSSYLSPSPPLMVVYFLESVYFFAQRTQNVGWPVLALLSGIYAIFGVLSTGLVNSAVVYKNWQISGMTTCCPKKNECLRLAWMLPRYMSVGEPD